MFYHEQEIMVAKLKQLEVEQNSRNAWRFFDFDPKQKKQAEAPIKISLKDCCA
ncbi:hypothetical protein [Peribacillus acanthi]|uniref:hypothetical protein n=1 Tax=Peribacillus acanthi TaxID=2171554 RepID=UPI0013005F33|nr:hypothetical protein [Peribacillus acanthi]